MSFFNLKIIYLVYIYNELVPNLYETARAIREDN